MTPNRGNLLRALPDVGRYTATVLAVVCVLAIRLALQPMLADKAPYIVFFLTIVLVKRLWGAGPSLFATLLGGVAAWYFLVEPQFTFVITHRIDQINLVAYLAVGALISLLGDGASPTTHSAAAGGKIVRRRLFRQTAVLAGAAFILGGMILLLLRDFQRSQDAEGWVVHTYKVIDSAQSLISTIEDAETGQRGFLLTGEEHYLEPYRLAAAALPGKLQELKDLTSDNPVQQRRWVEIDQFARERMTFLKRAIDLRANQGPEAAVSAIRAGEGKLTMGKLRSTAESLVGEERLLLEKRTEKADEEDARERWVLGLGSAALVLLLVFASVAIERDTERREEITQALRRHSDLLEQAHDSLLTCRLGGPIDYWSGGAEILYGYTREEAIGQPSHDLLRSTHPLGIAHIDALLERDGHWKGELTQATKDGRNLIVESQWTLAVDGQGNKTVLEANHDVTQRKLTEEKLRESESQFRTLANAIPQLCWMANANGWITWYNDRWYQYTGTTPEQMEGWGWQSVHDPDALPQVMERWKESLATAKPFDMVFPLRGADGAFRPFLTRIMPVCGQDGKLVRWFGTNTDISDQRRTEEALRESEAKLAAALSSMTDAVFISDNQGRFIHFNEAFAAFHRFSSKADCLNNLEEYPKILELLLPDGIPLPLDMWSVPRALRGEAAANVEYTVRRKDTGESWIGSYTFAPIHDENGAVAGSVVVARDITERKRAEAERGLLATAIEQASETVVVTDVDAKIQYVNPAFTRTTGYTRNEAQGQNPRILKSDRHDSRFYQEMWATLGAGKIWKGEFTNRRRDGTFFEEEATIAPVRDPSGKTINYIAIKSDITERKRAEIALRESELRLRLFVHHAPAAIAMLDREMRYVVVSDRWFEDYHLEYRDLTGLSHYEIFPEVSSRWKEVHRRCLDGAVESCPEDLFIRADGTFDWVRWEVRPWRKIDDTIGGIIIFSELITERKKTEKALEESESRYRQLFERAETALAVYEMVFDSEAKPRDFRFLEVNPAFERVTGLKRSAILGRTALTVTPGMEGYWVELFGRVAATGEPATFEQFARHLGRYYSGTAYSPRPNQVAVTFMDVTERKHAEEALHQLNAELEQRVRQRTSALEAANRELEAFAHSVSHDLRAPLRGIDGWSLALLEDNGGQLDAQGRKHLDRVRSEAQRMGRLIDDLLHLSRVSRTEMMVRPVDFTALAGTIVARLKEANPGRPIEFLVAPRLTCTGDVRLLEIALTNLLANAVKFTAPRNPARIEFGQDQGESPCTFFVRDNGVGFDMAYARMLFAPFQRLHKTSEFPGTGIGLATVQRVIRRHGGRIWAESQVGMGATFYFTLGEEKS